MPSVLCADDEKRMLRLYAEILGARGYDLRLCDNGRQAVDTFAKDPTELVILDVRMPGMDGLEACRQLRQLPGGGDVPIIMVSAGDTEDDVAHGFSCGADDYLVKPFHTGEFLAKVSVAMQRGHRGGDGQALAPGSVFAERYEIVREIGRGGFSAVLLATDTQADPPRQVALKVIDLPPGRRHDRRSLALFLREAYEHSKLDHPNIAALYDFGKTNEHYWLAMEYVDGKALDQMVLTNGPLEQESLALVGYEMAKALTYMSFNGMLHRDIKPGNIMVTRDGDVKLLDFGLARQENDETISLEDEFHGTPQYASPEFIANRGDLDIRADIYGLGATLYYAATGRKPFPGDSIVEVLNNHFETVPPPIAELRDDYGEAVSDLVAGMLARRRQDRPSLVTILDTLEHELTD